MVPKMNSNHDIIKKRYVYIYICINSAKKEMSPFQDINEHFNNLE